MSCSRDLSLLILLWRLITSLATPRLNSLVPYLSYPPLGVKFQEWPLSKDQHHLLEHLTLESLEHQDGRRLTSREPVKIAKKRISVATKLGLALAAFRLANR
jgi:hypothetical protein